MTALANMKQHSIQTIPTLIKILKDGSKCAVFNDVVLVFFAMGLHGLESLIESCSEACTEWDSLAL